MGQQAQMDIDSLRENNKNLTNDFKGADNSQKVEIKKQIAQNNKEISANQKRIDEFTIGRGDDVDAIKQANTDKIIANNELSNIGAGKPIVAAKPPKGGGLSFKNIYSQIMDDVN